MFLHYLLFLDTLSVNNIVYWDKTSYTNVDSFIVYRETFSNNYERIGAVFYESLSLFVDTVRTLYFPFTGDPDIGTYRYKLQIRDTCGNYGSLSNYHNTLYVTKTGGAFNWNDYRIENEVIPIPQLTAYYLLRDNNSTGNWVVIGGVSGSQLTINDPQYSSYPNARWRLETQWSIDCTPTKSINTSRSNIVGNMVGISSVNENSTSVEIYPNPFTTYLNIEINNFKNTSYGLKIDDLLGRTVFESEINAPFSLINRGQLQSGVYIVKIVQDNEIIVNKKVVIQ